jgi:hypothetical protein
MEKQSTSAGTGLPGPELLQEWKLKNFSPAFGHDAAMAYRDDSKEAFLEQADKVYESILRMGKPKP